jgi:hypothetical protein
VPVIVRNRLLRVQRADHKSSTRRWYSNRLLDRQIAHGEEWLDGSLRDRIRAVDPAAVRRARQLVDRDPYLSFRKAPVCPEWLSNECRHGAACFYAHALPAPGEHSPDFSKFGVRCRFLGTVDPNGKAIIEMMMISDQEAFARGEEPEDAQEGRSADAPRTEEGPMTPPEHPVRCESAEPLAYEGVDGRDIEGMPKYVGGRLVMERVCDAREVD